VRPGSTEKRFVPRVPLANVTKALPMILESLETLSFLRLHDFRKNSDAVLFEIAPGVSRFEGFTFASVSGS